MITLCDRCGLCLDEAHPRFIVEIQVTADVSPSLDTDLSEEEVHQALLEVMDQLEKLSALEAENEVHQKMVFVLCAGCRAKFVQNPLGTGLSRPRCLQ